MKHETSLVAPWRRSRRTRVLAATTIAAVASTLVATAMPTAAMAVDGGTSSNNPAVVSVYSYSSDGKTTQTCTGVQVSETVILTAGHCDSGGGWLLSWPTGSNGDYRGDFTSVASAKTTTEGDLSVLRLASPHRLDSYPPVNAQYVAHAGDKIALYGARGSQQRTLNGTVVGEGFESFGGPTIQVTTPGGGTRSGDSGGPLLVDGKVVGVLSRINNMEDSWYTRLSGAGVAALIAEQLPGTSVGNLGGVSTAPYYEIKNVASGLALDTRDGTVGGQTTQQPFTGATSQQWTLIRDGNNVRIVNRKSGLVIGVPAGSHTAGEKTVQWDALGVRDQAWNKVQQPDGTYTFTNGESGQALTAQSTSAGGAIVQDDAHGVPAEKWTIVRVG